MEIILKILKFAKFILERGSQLFGILGGFSAVYALLQPGAAIDFLEKLQNSNSEISENTNKIEKNTKSIEENTKSTAQNIPYWLNLKILNTNSFGGFDVTYENPTNFSVREVTFRFFQGEREVKELKTILPPKETLTTSLPTYSEYPASDYTICVSGVIEATGDKVYERRVYPFSEQDVFIRYNSMKDYVFSEYPTGICS
jgi:hypothetical protein